MNVKGVEPVYVSEGKIVDNAINADNADNAINADNALQIREVVVVVGQFFDMGDRVKIEAWS
jgi:hypothetical protein